jgi:alpha/beta superfamily hydrolase
MSEATVVFSHGLDSTPSGTKIIAMSAVARRHELAVESIDYQGMSDPAQRVAKLLAWCRQAPGPFVLVGSSLGAHVSAAVSSQVPTRGMFLLAPAFYMPGYEQYTPVPSACPISIVQGWNDDVVLPQNVVRWAALYKATLQLIDSDHRLQDSIDKVCEYFDLFLTRLKAGAA